MSMPGVSLAFSLIHKDKLTVNGKSALIAVTFVSITAAYVSSVIARPNGGAVEAQMQSQAQSLVDSAKRDHRLGHYRAADQMLARAYEKCTNQPYHRGQLHEICRQRADVNRALGNEDLAMRFEQQAQEFKKVDARLMPEQDTMLAQQPNCLN
jgi:hypothetical protein